LRQFATTERDTSFSIAASCCGSTPSASRRGDGVALAADAQQPSIPVIGLNGFRRREAKLFSSCGVKLPRLSACSQPFVDVAFGPI
jgi:hypothetical protein